MSKKKNDGFIPLQEEKEIKKKKTEKKEKAPGGFT